MKPNDSETHDVLKAALKADHLHAPGYCSHQRQRYVRKRTWFCPRPKHLVQKPCKAKTDRHSFSFQLSTTPEVPCFVRFQEKRLAM